jgi:hypothetical protein
MGRPKGSKNKKRGPGRPPKEAHKPVMVDASALMKALAQAGISLPLTTHAVPIKGDELKARAAARIASEKAKKDGLPHFALVVRDKKTGDKIRALTGRTFDQAFAERRDWYKILVLSLGLKVVMQIEYQAA